MLLSSQTPRKLAKVAFNLLTSARFYATHYLQQNSALRDQSENATRDRTLVDFIQKSKESFSSRSAIEELERNEYSVNCILHLVSEKSKL